MSMYPPTTAPTTVALERIGDPTPGAPLGVRDATHVHASAQGAARDRPARKRVRQATRSLTTDMISSRAPPVDDRFKMVVASFFDQFGKDFGDVRLSHIVLDDGSSHLELCRHKDLTPCASIDVDVGVARRLTTCPIGADDGTVRVTFDPRPPDATASELYRYTFTAGQRRRTGGSQAGQVRWFYRVGLRVGKRMRDRGAQLLVRRGRHLNEFTRDHQIRLFLQHRFASEVCPAAA